MIVVCILDLHQWIHVCTYTDSYTTAYLYLPYYLIAVEVGNVQKS